MAASICWRGSFQWRHSSWLLLLFWAGAAFGWEAATFRVFCLFGAILSVPPIALGTITLGLGGALNSVAEEMTAFALSLAVGTAFLFAGFLLATIPKTQPPDSAA